MAELIDQLTNTEMLVTLPQTQVTMLIVTRVHFVLNVTLRKKPIEHMLGCQTTTAASFGLSPMRNARNKG